MEALATLWSSTQFTIQKLPYYLRLKNLGNRFLDPFYRVEIENAYFQVKTITTAVELAQVLKLRFNVFYGEFAPSKRIKTFLKYDVDLHDFICDHLIVKDKTSDQVVACYRLLHSDQIHRVDHYYSEAEFDLAPFLALEGKKLELGRACVHKDYRSGQVIALLWKGLCDYARQSEARYLFGCSSVGQKELSHLPQILEELRQGQAFISDYMVKSKSPFKLEPRQDNSDSSVRRSLNSLMHMYLMAGAKFSSDVAFDEDMNCVDLFTVVDFSKLPPSFERRFAC